MPIEMIEEFDLGTRIKVISVGGGGGNAIEHMIAKGVQRVEFVLAGSPDGRREHPPGAVELLRQSTSWVYSYTDSE